MTLVSPMRGYALVRLDGDIGTMEWWALRFTRLGDRLDDLSTSASSASGLPGVGQAVTAVRRDALRLVGDIGAGLEEAALLGRVLADYAAAHDLHASRANALIDDIEAAHAKWSVLDQDAADARALAAAMDAGGADEALLTATQTVATEAAEALLLAEEALSALWAEYERHRGDWEDAYDAALAALVGTMASPLRGAAGDVLARMMGADDPAEVLALWKAHPELHDQLLAARPDVIGNLDGIPYDVRDTANRERLDDLLATEPDGPRRDELKAIRRALEAEGSPRPALISFDPDGADQTTAAIAHGDVMTAYEISTLVPGMNGNVGDLYAWGESARALNRAVGPGSAAVVWFGYDTPDLLEEPGMSRAEDGAVLLASYLRGLRDVVPGAEVNVVAHSYGSTTAALAIGSAPDGLGVTSFVAVGSAGFPDDEDVLANLDAVGAPRIYATISEDDGIARIGRGTAFGHGVSPERLPGVTVFDSDGGVDAAGGSLPAATGHSALGPGAYLEPGSESFYNVSQIIRTGEPGTERDGAGSTKGFWDASNWWISDEYAFIDF